MYRDLYSLLKDKSPVFVENVDKHVSLSKNHFKIKLQIFLYFATVELEKITKSYYNLQLFISVVLTKSYCKYRYTL